MSKGKSNPGREARVEIVVGVFVALVLTGLGIFTIVVSGASLFRDGTFVIEVVMPDAMGLRRNDPVIARGTTVGTVSKVYYDRDGVHVEAELEAPVDFYEDYEITVVATSILGGRQLVLSEGDPARAKVEDVRKLKGEKPADIMEDATAAIERIREFLDTDALDNLRQFSEDLKAVSGRLERGEGTLGKLLSSDDEVYTNLNAAVANIRDISDRLERGEGTLGKLLSSDDEVYTNLNATVANIRAVTDRLERGEGTLGKLLSSDDEVYANLNETLADFRAIADRLEAGEGTLGRLLSSDDAIYTNLVAAVENLRVVSDRLAQGKGTLGKLLSEDSTMYDNLDGAVSDVRETLDDLREANTLSTFSSLLFSGF
ncbi:MAG: MlaD family protein [Kiritimatiellia bacterium]|jgi:phospholipid/cholesterol/gamma-HCH transport system substrate-binding protein